MKNKKEKTASADMVSQFFYVLFIRIQSIYLC
nr:MAG TPA: hypothetical protein [Caudoviricetes sp.]DAV65181.1 MAG TPA: hypothetical protein [Caudoviricetes sp.]